MLKIIRLLNRLALIAIGAGVNEVNSSNNNLAPILLKVEKTKIIISKKLSK